MEKIPLSFTGGNYFEQDAVFAGRAEAIPVIMKFYKRVMWRADFNSRIYVETLDPELMRESLWYISQCKALEQVLALFQACNDDDQFEVDIDDVPEHIHDHVKYRGQRTP